jgi:membrane-associated phospholipid phosphatase
MASGTSIIIGGRTSRGIICRDSRQRTNPGGATSSNTGVNGEARFQQPNHLHSWGGSDWVTSQRTLRYRVDLPLEQHIPFVPAAIVFYMSLYPLFWVAPFILRCRRQLAALSATLALVILIAGLCFLAIPAELAYSTHRPWGRWAGWYNVADQLNLHYNLLPSLHVALSIACVSIYASHASNTVRIGLWLWGGAIAASTLLTHEHHMLDVLTGWLLALACVRIVYNPWIRRSKRESLTPETLQAVSRGA